MTREPPIRPGHAGSDAGPFHRLVSHAPMGIAHADPRGVVDYANERWRELSGFQGELPAPVIELLEIVQPQDRDRVVEIFRRRPQDGSEVRAQVRVHTAEGARRDLSLAVQPILDPAGCVEGYAIGLSDVTELTTALGEVHRSAERFRLATEALPVGIFTTDPDACLTWANPWLAQLSGYPAEEIVGTPVFGFQHPEDADEVYLGVLDALLRKEPFESQHRFVNRDGSVRWVIVRSVPVYDDDGRIIEHVGTMEDVTELHLRSEGLAHQAAHDPLTGLPNRASILAELDRLCEAIPGRHDIGVVFVDLDRFKSVNDNHGHHAGDEVLVHVAARLSSVIRSGDAVGRFGGDEFVLICPGIADEEMLAGVARRARSAIEDAPISDRGTSHSIGASIGTALGPGLGSAGELLHRADTAMYEEKRLRSAQEPA